MIWRQMLDTWHFYDTDEFPDICAGVLLLMQSSSIKACQNFGIQATFPFLMKTKVKDLSTCLNSAMKTARV